MSRPFRARPNQALAELMAADAEAEGTPFGGWAGEMATPSREPTPQPPPPFLIPPPDWVEPEAPELPPPAAEPAPEAPQIPKPPWAVAQAGPLDPDRADPPEEETP